MDKRLFLVDAFALIFRAYYALIRSPRITSKGKNTNAQFGPVILPFVLTPLHQQKGIQIMRIIKQTDRKRQKIFWLRSRI
jgi:5'-3' exonuclease